MEVVLKGGVEVVHHGLEICDEWIDNLYFEVMVHHACDLAEATAVVERPGN